MEEKETEARLLTLTKPTWKSLDEIATKYGYLNAQEVIRQCVAKMINNDPS